METTKHLNYVAGRDSVHKTRLILENDQHLLTLTRPEIEQLQQLRLREMLAYAIAHSSWYKNKLGSIDVPHFKLTDLPSLPMMTKRDLMDHWDEIVTDQRLNMHDAGQFLKNETDYALFHGHHLFASGGSSGRRGMYVWHADEVAIAVAGLYRYQYRDGFLRHHEAEACRVASIAALKPVHLSETVFAFPVVPSMESLALSALAPIDTLVNELNAYQPTHLNGYPSVIARLANQAVRGKLTIAPKRILVGAEPLLDHMVELIKKAWPAVIISNQWGSTDAGAHAAACDYSHSNLHLNEDLVIIEPVDEHNQPVPHGTKAAKILITNLYRKSMPIFRYEMDDAITVVDEVCPCGSKFQLIHSISGRHEDDFVYQDIVVMAELFENTIMPEPGIDEYQVFQTPHGADISIVSVQGMNVDLEKMQSALVSQLEEVGLSSPVVHVKLVEQLERHPETCKLKRFNTLSNQQNKKSKKSK